MLQHGARELWSSLLEGIVRGNGRNALISREIVGVDGRDRMCRTGVVLLAMILTAGCCASGAITGGFYPGTGAEVRSSANYLIEDTLGQFVVGESKAPSDAYSCGWIEHGCRHSEIHVASLAEIKAKPEYSYVSAYSKVVTAGTDQFAGTFYAEELDRTCGLRVATGANPITVSQGDIVDVRGVIRTSSRERYIAYPEIVVRFRNAAQIDPVFIHNNWLGGAGLDILPPGGASNLSLLVKTAGRVTYVDKQTPCRFFYIDDGSGVSDGTVIDGKLMRGLRIYIAGLAPGNTILPPATGDFVTVTGICAPQLASGGRIVAQIRPRSQADIQLIPQ
jgi:uncharacterized membrane protein YgdD (TMEM256/DUF423 family)